VIRFIISCLVALSLLGGAPAMAALATQPMAASECSMVGKASTQPSKHEKMACCTSDCTVTGTAALAQRDSVQLPSPEAASAPLFLIPVSKLKSVDGATVDPPPRTRLS
jgi:hypothetical protein